LSTGLPDGASVSRSTGSFVGDDFLKCQSFLVIVSGVRAPADQKVGGDLFLAGGAARQCPEITVSLV